MEKEFLTLEYIYKNYNIGDIVKHTIHSLEYRLIERYQIPNLIMMYR